MIYNVGDRVVFKKEFPLNTPAFVPAMNKLRGRVVTVIKVDTYGANQEKAFYYFDEDPSNFAWHENMIEGLADSTQCADVGDDFLNLIY